MKVTAIVLYLSILRLLQFCNCDFPANSLVVPAVSGSSNFLQILNIEGARLATINTPSGKSFAPNCRVHLNTDGSIATVAMYSGSSPYTIYGYTFAYTGQISSTTTLTSQSSTASIFVVNGDDAWFLVGTDVVYQARGTSGSGTVIGSNVNQMQLIGSNLYLRIDRDLYVMSPVVKTGTGSITPMTLDSGMDSFHIKGRIIYTANAPTFLAKYNLDAAGTTASFAVGQNIKDDIPGGISSLVGVDIGGTPYLLMLAQGASNSYLYRYTDNGYNFGTLTTFEPSVNSVTYFSVGASPKPTCTDGILNQQETSVDCGGPNCAGCPIGKVCYGDNDCLGKKCSENICVASCSDGLFNQDESDIDCGGSICTGCPIGKNCTAPSDCLGNKCTDGYCAESCTDGLVNQDETDVDCGGIICNNGCAYGKICAINTDCISLKCNNLLCDISCFDAVQNQNETGIDCGGPCSPCADGNGCLQESDCESNYCNPNNLCSFPSCSDGFKNLDETDVDCGGSTCTERCSNGKSCVKDTDCASNLCNSVCVAPPVATPIEAPSPIISSPDSAPSNSAPVSSTPVAKQLSTGANTMLSNVIVTVSTVMYIFCTN